MKPFTSVPFIDELSERDLLDRATDIARAYGVNVTLIGTDDRHDDVCAARDHFAYVLVDELGMSYPEAGRLLRRDHTSVMQAVRRFALACGDVSYARPRHVKSGKMRVAGDEKSRGAA